MKPSTLPLDGFVVGDRAKYLGHALYDFLCFSAYL